MTMTMCSNPASVLAPIDASTDSDNKSRILLRFLVGQLRVVVGQQILQRFRAASSIAVHSR